MMQLRASVMPALCLALALAGNAAGTMPGRRASPSDDHKLYPNGVKKPASYCQRQLDLTILVDESASIAASEWEKLIPFLKSVVRSVNVGPNFVHVALVTYSTTIRWLISFLDPASKDESLALKTIDMLRISKPSHGLTFTGQALHFIREAVYPLGARKNAPKALILITDGASTQPNITSQASAMLRDQGVTLLVVGVGSARAFECRAVVGCPLGGECSSFFMTKWEDIISKVGGLITEVCETIPQDAVCKPIWSEWSRCMVKCGSGFKYKKLMSVSTLVDATVGTNGKAGKTCEQQFADVEEPKEECFVECEEEPPAGSGDSGDTGGDSTGETGGDNITIGGEDEDPEYGTVISQTGGHVHDHEHGSGATGTHMGGGHGEGTGFGPNPHNYTTHESIYEDESEESSTHSGRRRTSRSEETQRSGAKIAGGVALALMMLGAGGGYAYYKKWVRENCRRKPAGSVEARDEENFSEGGLIHNAQEAETFTVTNLDDGLWSESH